MSRAVLGPEFELLLRCCRWNFARGNAQERPELPADPDWDRVVTLARRHRVLGLVWNALAQQADQLPDYVAKALSTDARSIAATNLAIAAECHELGQAFAAAGLPLLYIKGLTVGALAYRSPLLKMGWDIDLLIDPRDLSASASLLSERGYMLCLPADLADLPSWHGRSKESVWHRGEGFYVELHTRLADNRRLIPTIDVNSPRRWVSIVPTAPLPTLADEELVAYLTVHGASSAWFRLKWISDFAALIHGRSDEEMVKLYQRSQEIGAGRAAGQALLLADALFDSLQASPDLKERIASDRATRLLCRAALRMMTRGRQEPTVRLLGTLPIHWTQFLLQPGMAYKASEFWRQARDVLKRVT